MKHFHPVALFGRAAGGVETLCRKTFGNGIFSGLTGWLLLVLPISAAAWAVTRFAGEFAPAVAAVLLYVTIAPRSLLEHAEAIRKPLSRNDLAAARRVFSRAVSPARRRRRFCCGAPTPSTPAGATATNAIFSSAGLPPALTICFT